MRRSAFAGGASIALLLGQPAAGQSIDAPTITNEPVDQGVIDTVRESLPESRAVGATFLDPAYEPTLLLSEDGQVMVTFVDEGAGYQNSLGYFSYPSGTLDGYSKADLDVDGNGVLSVTEMASVPGVETGWVFPDATKAPGRLQTGDTVTLGDGTVYAADTSIGFSLVQNGWDGAGVKGVTSPGNPQTFYTLDFVNPEAAPTSTSADSGVGNTRHVAMLFEDTSKEAVLMGFEDLNRDDRNANDRRYRSDEDFNDAVFVIRSNPISALAGSDIATAPGPLAGSAAGGALVLGFLLYRRWSQSVMCAGANMFKVRSDAAQAAPEEAMQ